MAKTATPKPREKEKLTDDKCRDAKAVTTPIKLSDGGGLQLLVAVSGKKSWWLAYRFDGKQKSLGLGDFPDKSVDAARATAALAKGRLKEGVDPGAPDARDSVIAASPEDSFGYFADRYIAKMRQKKRAPATVRKTQWILGYKSPGDPEYIEGLAKRLRPVAIGKLKPADIARELDRVQERGHLETARRMKVVISGACKFAVWRGAIEEDPTRDLKGGLDAPKKKPRAAIVDPKGFGQLLLMIDGYTGHPVVRLALQILALTFTRPGELRLANWSEIDFRAKVWTVAAARTKMRREHKIPLTPKTLALFKKLHAITGDGELCFPSIRSRGQPLSDGALNAALRAMGVDGDTHVAHGFRSSASTLLNQACKDDRSLNFDKEIIETALAHGDSDDKDDTRSTYNRAEYWKQRVALAEFWEEYCERRRKFASTWRRTVESPLIKRPRKVASA